MCAQSVTHKSQVNKGVCPASDAQITGEQNVSGQWGTNSNVDWWPRSRCLLFVSCNAFCASPFPCLFALCFKVLPLKTHNTHTHTYTHLHTYTHTWTHTHTHTHRRAWGWPFFWITSGCKAVPHFPPAAKSVRNRIKLCAVARPFAHVCALECVCVCVTMFVCVYVWLCMRAIGCVYICVWTCTYVCCVYMYQGVYAYGNCLI
jgi:hypothetical protein